MLKLEDFARQRLAQGEDGAAAEALKVHQLRHLLADFEVFFYLPSFGEGYLAIAVYEVFICHHLSAARDFEVALVGIDDDGVVFVAAKELGDDTAETFLKHTEECGLVNVLHLVELVEGFNERLDGFLTCFLCHV